jgi:disulfide bond formation protein DsbB
MYLYLLPTFRLFWLALLLTALGLEAAALYFQYVMELDPCVLCVYERLAVAGIALSGLLGVLAPSHLVWRIVCYAVWAASAIWGLTLAMEHVGIQFGTGNLNCEFFANFPDWFKLDQWLPSVFTPTGYCADIQWQFLSLTMPQWMLLVYSGYLLLLMLILVLELRRPAPDGL